MHSFLYNIHKTYNNNYRLGPVGLKKLKKPHFHSKKPKYKFLGFPVDLPFGIPAGPLLNSKFIKGAFSYGFPVLVYKTVRSSEFPCHPYPNVVYVNSPSSVHPKKTPLVSALNINPQNPTGITITNSFGVPSEKPQIWQKDVKKVESYRKNGQLLILSFMGTVKKDQTSKELVEDFVRTARLAKQTGAKVLEVNFSCPNIGNEGLICYNLEATERISRAIRKAIGKTPLILKVGYYENDKDIKEIARIVNKYANAISLINTIAVKVVDKYGRQALPGPNRLKSGLCGASIKWAGLEMVGKFNKLRIINKYKFEIIGIGGVMSPDDFLQYRKAGADLVQSATGAMWNPHLAYEIYKVEHEM